MRATAYPDGIAVPLTIIGDDDRDEAVPGGYGRATFTALLSTNDRQRILGAPVYIYATAGPPWAGKVSRVAQVKHGVCKVECDGWQEAFGRKIREATYCDTNFLADLRDLARTDLNSSAFSVSVSGGVATLAVRSGATVAAGNQGGYYYWGDQELTQLTFSANVSHADVSFIVYASTTGEKARDSAVYTKTATGAQTGQTATFAAGTYGFVIVCNADTSITPTTTGYYATCYDMKLYATDVTTVTVYNVIDDICDQLDTDDLPAGTVYRSYLEADATTVEPLVFSEDSTDAAKVEEVMRYTTKEFGVWCRRINGVWTPVPVLRDPGTSHDYVCVVGKGCTADISDLDTEPLASKVRVLYADTDGRTRYTDRTDTDASHYLVKRGIEKWATVRADTTSATLAATIGDNFLALAGEAQVSGDITITSAIRDASGGRVLPCEIEAGRRILVLGLDSGAVTARITSVKKRGSYHAVVTINNKPRALDVFLARLAKREAA